MMKDVVKFGHSKDTVCTSGSRTAFTVRSTSRS